MDLPDLTPSGMVGWLEELDRGEPMVLQSSRELRVKIVASPERIAVFALAEPAGTARELLLRLGFAPDQVKRMLCG